MTFRLDKQGNNHGCPVRLQPGTTWVVDTTGPIEPIGFDGSRYRWTFFVEFPVRYTLVYLLAENSAYSFVLVQFLAEVRELGFSVSGLVLRSDCAPELCDPAALQIYRRHNIQHRTTSPTLHWQNFMAEYVIGKISRISRAILETAGMDHTYWPLADAHSRLLWDIMPHGLSAVVPHYHLLGHHFTYSRVEIFGTYCYVSMDDQQMRARHPGVSKKRTPRAWHGRFVGIDLRSSAYLVLDLERNKVVQVGMPLFIWKYTEFGQVMSTFPDPTVAPEPAPAVEQQRPQPWQGYTTDMVVTLHYVSSQDVEFCKTFRKLFGIARRV
eukprot:gene4905-5986_t